MGGKSSKFDELFSHLKQVNTHIIIIGLQNTGKSTILKKMGLKSRIDKMPMVGMPILTIKSSGNVRITTWDIGGPGKLKCMWEHFFGVTKGIVFVVDSTNKEALPEARRELYVILNNKKLTGVPLMVMVNKQDIEEAMELAEMSRILNLCELERMWDIVPTCGLTGDGIYEAMKSLVDMMKITLYERNKTVHRLKT